MIYLAQPDPGESVSGGFRFNRAILARLERDRIGRATTLDAVAEERLRPSDTLVVDSLYLSRPPDVVDAFSGRLCVLCHFLPSRQPHLDEGARAALARTEREWLRKADRVVVPSFRFEAKLRKLAPRAAEVRVVTPGLGSAFRLPTPTRRSSPDDRPLRLVTVDALTEAKNVAAIVGALRHVDPSEFSWDIAGDLDREPAYRERFCSELERLGLTKRVTLHGALPPASVAALLDRADLYVTASREESYGMATAEAVSRALPVIGFDVGCASKWVISGVNGWLIGDHHQSELGTVLVRSIVDRTLLGALTHGAARARERIRFPSWGDTYREFRRALEPDVERPRRAGLAPRIDAGPSPGGATPT